MKTPEALCARCGSDGEYRYGDAHSSFRYCSDCFSRQRQLAMDGAESIIGIAAKCSAKLYVALGVGNDLREQDIIPFTIECIYLFAHILDRRAFQVQGDPIRAILGELVVSSLVKAIIQWPEVPNERSVVYDHFNKRQETYGGMSTLLGTSSQPVADTVFWEFAKNTSAMLPIQEEDRPEAVIFAWTAVMETFKDNGMQMIDEIASGDVW